jgi:hypothetical protein
MEYMLTTALPCPDPGKQYKLTVWSEVLEKLKVTQLDKNFRAS